jgi:hypothetical protein
LQTRVLTNIREANFTLQTINTFPQAMIQLNHDPNIHYEMKCEAPQSTLASDSKQNPSITHGCSHPHNSAMLIISNQKSLPEFGINIPLHPRRQLHMRNVLVEPLSILIGHNLSNRLHWEMVGT